MKILQWLATVCLIIPVAASWAQHEHHHHHHMQHDENGMVMHENKSVLPRGCEEIAGDESLTVYASRDYAAETPGTIFGMSQHTVAVPGCTRLEVTFINRDEVRHQWMVHGLPKYLHPAGMFHLEAMAGKQVTGTFITPPDDKTYLIHCDMAQHMEKGMKGQLVVGGGSGELWSVRGDTDVFERASYLPRNSWAAALGALLLPLLGVGIWQRRKRR